MKERSRKETRRKRAEKGRKKEKTKKERTMEVKKVVEEQEIWDKEEEAAKLKEEAKRLVLERFYKWIYIFGKKASKRMLTRKLWDHTIDMKEGFVPRKEKVYPLLREERGEMHEFISE